MSLINREELLNAFGLSENTRKHGGDGSGYNTLMLYEIQDTIEDAAEVEAIHIDWINQRIEALAETGGLLANLGAALVMKMVDEWKQEQNG